MKKILFGIASYSTFHPKNDLLKVIKISEMIFTNRNLTTNILVCLNLINAQTALSQTNQARLSLDFLN